LLSFFSLGRESDGKSSTRKVQVLHLPSLYFFHLKIPSVIFSRRSNHKMWSLSTTRISHGYCARDIKMHHLFDNIKTTLQRASFWSTSSLELVFVKFKKFKIWTLEKSKKIPRVCLSFVLHVCEFVLRNTLYSFLSKNDKISDLRTYFHIWEHVPKFV
jgi:hypothetical protein